ncbi:Tyrosine-protein phosphatase [Drechslerella dactyloides]|uniref:Tyrosine-protein phosphatase n=1 Tax=Drechslerella dactyloides TaxID=74499 RepID=A0AAD6J3W2_DREDA|nr:Tyrosine-protein phosphatase [Drechslerella dactyloides]
MASSPAPSSPLSTAAAASHGTTLQIPPLSFALVSTGVYRSGCPMPLNFPFLAKLHLKSIIYIADQDLPVDLQHFTAENDIQVFHFRMHHGKGAANDGDVDHDPAAVVIDDMSERDLDLNHDHIPTSDPISPIDAAHDKKKAKKKKKKDKVHVVENDAESMRQALELLLDARNFPVLIHSNKGKHRSGVLVACVRKLLQNWAFGSVKSEYHYFAGEKGQADIEFIEKFRPTLKYDERYAPGWLRDSPGEGTLINIRKPAGNSSLSAIVRAIDLNP